MGLDISTLKLKKRLGNEVNEDIEREYEDYAYIYTLDFPPINHLSAFEVGVYDVEWGEYGSHFSYGGFYRFREMLCQMIYNKDFESVVDNVEKYLGQPFIEMIDFADNEGSFDYIIAEKLYQDFINYQKQASEILGEYMYEQYRDYMKCLKETIDCKGVMYYH